MKKLFLFLVILFTTISTTFAQSGAAAGAMTVINSAKQSISETVDSTKKAVKDGATFIDTSSNFKTIYTDIKTNIGALASALKVGAEHVYYVLVKQQIVNSIVWLIVAIIVGISFRGMIKYSKWCRDNKIDEDNVGYVFGLFFGWIFTVISIVIVIFHIDVIVTGFVNPEYGAIMDIVNFVK
jgi:hypothetical protein